MIICIKTDEESNASCNIELKQWHTWKVYSSFYGIGSWQSFHLGYICYLASHGLLDQVPFAIWVMVLSVLNWAFKAQRSSVEEFVSSLQIDVSGEVESSCYSFFFFFFLFFSRFRNRQETYKLRAICVRSKGESEEHDPFACDLILLMYNSVLIH